MSDKLGEILDKTIVRCVCKKCGCKMTGYPGDDECSDCWMGFDREAFNKNFEETHFKRTGERKTTGEICRGILGM